MRLCFCNQLNDSLLHKGAPNYISGDGFTNMITPTSGVLVAALGMASVPYIHTYIIWVKWVWKFILALIILGFLFLLPTIFMDLTGF